MERIGSPPQERQGGRLVVGWACTATVLVMIPVFLVGSFSVVIRQELGFGQAQLGLAVALFFLASALASLPGGRLADSLGARRTLLYATFGAAAGLLGIGALARSWWSLALILCVTGVCSGVAQPAANVAIAQHVRSTRQGVAFGLLKSSVPAATLIAGACIPLLGAALGWRWAFSMLAMGWIAVAVLSPRKEARATVRPRRAADPSSRATRRFLGLLALAQFLAGSAISAMAVFFVEFQVASGSSIERSGALLAFASGAGVACALAAGWLIDRRGSRHALLGVAGLLVLGAVGLLGLGLASSRDLITVSALVAFGAGWSWTGILNLAIVTHVTAARGAAIGLTQGGGHLGAVVGPPCFGILTEAAGYPWAWIASAVALFASAGVVFTSSRLGRSTLRPAP